MQQPFFDQLNFNIMIVETKCHHDIASSGVIIKYLNDAACRLLGYRRQELDNSAIECISGPEMPNRFWQTTISEWSRQPQNNVYECRLRSKQGTSIPALISFSAFSTQKTQQDQIVLFIQNLTEVKQNTETLSLMLTAVEQSASAVVITNPEGSIEYVNPKFMALTGYSEQELLGCNPKMLQSGSTSPEIYQTLWEMLDKHGEWRGEIKNRKKNGELYWAYETISSIKNSQGEITHLLAIEEDITKRKLAEAALSESEERFRQMAEMTGEWLWEQDPKGYYSYSSAAVKAILGFTPEEVTGKHYTELLTPQDKVKQQHVSIIQQPFYSLINLYQHRDGHRVITESTGLPIKDESGKLIKWRGVDRDITARKHFQDALLESEKRNRLIIESALNAIIIMDSYGIITDWNIQAEKMFGWTKEQAINQRLDDLIIPPRFREAHRLGLENFIRTGKGPLLNKLIEHIGIRSDGTEFPVELSISPLKLGNSYIFSGFVHDISGRKKAEKTIREAQINMAITQNEMNIAHRIQSLLLPANPIQSPYFEVSGVCLPAAQVGGDYYDYFYIDEHNLALAIADVSGHSVGPALFMVETRSALRAQANQQNSPGNTLAKLNNLLYEELSQAEHFITMFNVQFNSLTNQLTYANAGHPPPLLFDQHRNRCIQLDADGMIFGVRENIFYEEKSIVLQRGDSVLLYTDGITEAENKNGEFFGVERLCQTFQHNADQDTQHIIDQIISELQQFSHRGRFRDDITLMIFKRT